MLRPALKLQHAGVHDRLERRYPQVLLDLADRGLSGRLAGFKPSSGSVDLAGAESAFFVDQQHDAVADHEQQRRAQARRPAIPGNVLEAHRARF